MCEYPKIKHASEVYLCFTHLSVEKPVEEMDTQDG